jgi:hypothetical protein
MPRPAFSGLGGMSYQLAEMIPSVGAEQVTVMLLAIAVVAAAGIAAGLFYKAGAALALSFAVLFATLIATLGQGWHFWHSMLAAFGLMVVLQLSYLLGAALAIGIVRAKAADGVRSTLSALFKRAD